MKKPSLKVINKEKNTRDEIFLLKAEKVPFTADVIEQLIKNLLNVISHHIVPYPYTFNHLPEDGKIMSWSTLYSETESDFLMKSCQLYFIISKISFYFDLQNEISCFMSEISFIFLLVYVLSCS